jgi:hypothetical protein
MLAVKNAQVEMVVELGVNNIVYAPLLCGTEGKLMLAGGGLQ